MSQFLNAAINLSPVIYASAGADILNPQHKAVSFDSTGRIVPSKTGDTPIGITIGCTQNVTENEGVSVLIYGVGYIVSSETLTCGDPIAADTDGLAKKAEAGDFILGFALENAAVGQHMQIQVTKSGYMI